MKEYYSTPKTFTGHL